MIPVYQPYLTGKEKEYVASCFDSTWISSRGEFVSRFEAEFEKFTGVRHATSVCNGTVALHLAMMALGLGPGDEVIVPTLTYVASVNTVVQAGATPVFVDSLRSTWQIDPKDVQRKITPRTKAVMAVHLYGAPCDMTSLTELCEQHGLFLIEDCAEAFGTLYRGKHVGTFGDIATFSFFGNKTITTGEGGMVVTNNSELFTKAYHLKTQGVSPTREYWHDTIGYNYRMTNICAAIGVAQLEHAGQILSKKRLVAEWYDEELADLPLTRHQEFENMRHSWWMYSILARDPDECSRLRNTLRLAGVETRPLFHPVHLLPPYFSGLSFPVAESLSSRGINLPSYPGLERRDVKMICQTIRAQYDASDSKIVPFR
ncbi:DegT/DnrJ/EryC1/StrS family aminotransferase [Bradyrhizobium sp.]|jgi:perosamine synthetase|uniref:DegT/DnrJ/EryC1/StrS family aminotransferase n=1 Tax=Bradyrhizobium sp. TaxID=376 RepID=UPI002DFA5C2D|nr:DegT/DnrJ/EryC1/StrS family aminotransferase [Bradyrhizobium sp.]